MRTFFAIGLALAVLAIAPAFADNPVKLVEAATTAAAAPKPVKPAAAKPEVKSPAAPSKRILAQQEAIKALKLADGDWRGPSKVLRKDGWAAMTEVQRVATLLDGTVLTIESRGYEADGRLNFGMFAVVSYDPDAKAYAMRTWSGGRERSYPLEVSADGFSWEFESGPQMTICYEAAIRNGVWTQTATRVPAEGKPEKYVEFAVKRVRGDRD